MMNEYNVHAGSLGEDPAFRPASGSLSGDPEGTKYND